MTTFSISGGPALQRRLTAIGDAPRQMLRDVGIGTVAKAKRLVPRRIGNLARTIHVRRVTDSSVEIMAGGTAKVGYAAAVEFGSRPHIIVPRNARVLAWGGPRTLGGRLRKGGRATNFARRVNHPGTRAKPYLIPGFVKALRMVGLGSIIDRWNRAA